MGIGNLFSSQPTKLIEATEKKDLDKFKSLQPSKKDLMKSFDYKQYKKSNLLNVAAFNKSFDILKEIVKISPESISLHDKDGRSPLHVAISSNHFPMVEYLINNGADIDFESEDSTVALPIIFSLIKDIKIMELVFTKSPLIASGAHTIDSSEETFNRLAYKIVTTVMTHIQSDAEELGLSADEIEKEIIERFKFLKKINTDFNIVEPSTQSSFLYPAIELDLPEVLKYLLSIKINPNIEDFQGGFACDYAVAANKLHLVEIIQKAGGKFNTDEMREEYAKAG